MFIMQNCQIKIVITIVLQLGQTVSLAITSGTVKTNLRKAFIIKCFVKCSFFLILSYGNNVCQPLLWCMGETTPTNFLIFNLGQPLHITG